MMITTPLTFRRALMAKKLPQGHLADSFKRLGEKFGYKNLQIWVIPSLGDKTVNGMQVGLSGISSRIFLYETLLNPEVFTEREMEAVLAHELAHAKKRHIIKLLIFLLIILSVVETLSVYIIHDIFNLPSVYETILNIILFIPAYMAFTFFQRKYEFEADKGAAEGGYRDEIVSVLDKLTGKNLGIKKFPKILYLFVSHADFEGRKRHIDQLT